MTSYPLRALCEGEPTPYQRAAHYRFDRVTASQDGVPVVSLLGWVLSPYAAGPSLSWLADAASAVTGLTGGFGLASCRLID